MNIKLSYIYITLCLFIIILCIFLVVIGVIKPYPSNNDYINKYIKEIEYKTGFDNPRALSECLVYNTLTYNTDIVNALEPIANFNKDSTYVCDDGFTQALILVERTCVNPTCRGNDGTLYNKGETEIYYKKCAELKACENYRSIIEWPYPTPICLEIINNNFSSSSCNKEINIYNKNLIDVNMYKIYNNNETKLVQIRKPNSDLCLYGQGNLLFSDTCSGNSNNGFEWLYVPRTSIDASTYYSEQLIPYNSTITELDLSPCTPGTNKNICKLLAKSKSLQVQDNKCVLKTPEICNSKNCQSITNILTVTNLLKN